MKITDALRGEHAIMYELFEYVRETADKSDNVQEIHGAVAALERALVPHARIEENLLFPNLEPHLGQAGPLAVMLSEHQRLEELLSAAIKETDAGALKSVIGQMLELAYDHFHKEEQVLFGMAQQFLDEAKLTELGNEWAASRNVTV